VTNGLNACRQQVATCRNYATAATYVATICLTKLESLNETLNLLIAALNQLSVTTDALDLYLNGSTSSEAVGARSQRQAVSVVTITQRVVTLVVTYRTILEKIGKFGKT
jgi:hypothetical protein